jgi:hypothetical protein
LQKKKKLPLLGVSRRQGVEGGAPGLRGVGGGAKREKEREREPDDVNPVAEEGEEGDQSHTHTHTQRKRESAGRTPESSLEKVSDKC